VASSVKSPEIVLVLCHSFFHDAFRPHKPLDSNVFKTWMSSRFVANFIIEKQARLSEGSFFAFTSKQVFDNFASKFEGDKPSAKLIETVQILQNSMYIVGGNALKNLSDDDGVFVICDILYSRSNYKPILVSNIPRKVEKAETFYHKKDAKAKIPYPIYNAKQAELFLRSVFPDLCNLVDARLKNSLIKA
jgi:hypothetical protein